MSLKSEAIRILLSTLMTAESVLGTYSNVDQINEITSVVNSISSAEADAILKGIGVTIEDSSTAYLDYLYDTASSNTVNEVIKNGGSGLQAVTEVVESDGSITLERLPSETLNNSTQRVSSGGLVEAVSTGYLVGAILADLGLSSYGQYMYDTNEAYRESYNKINSSRFSTVVIDGQTYYYDNGIDNGGFRNVQAMSKFYEQHLDDLVLSDGKYYMPADVYQQLIDSGIYDPNKTSEAGILRTAFADAWDFYGEKFSQFFHKDRVEDLVRKLYDEGVIDSINIDSNVPDAGSYDTIKGVGGKSFVQANLYRMMTSSMIENHSERFTPADAIDDAYNKLIEKINEATNINENTVIVISAHSTMYGLSEVYITWGNYSGEVQLGSFRNTNVPAFPIANSGGYVYYTFNTSTVPSSKGSVSSVNYSNTALSGNIARSGNYISQFPSVIQNYLVTNYNTTVSDKNKSAIIKDNSNLKYKNVDDAIAHINTLPSFTTQSVNPKTGQVKTNTWVKMPIATKDVNDEEGTNLDDYVEDYDATQDIVNPVYAPNNVVTRPYDSSIDDFVNKPYSDKEQDEYTKPSPSDVVNNPTGGGSGKPSPVNPSPSNGTSGGSPVIVPPIVPIGGSSSALFSVYNPSQAQIDALGSYLWGSDIVELLAKFLQNPIDAVISLHQIYITPPTSESKNIKLGYLDSGVSAPCVSNQYVELDCGNVYITEYYNDARDYSPWTQVQIYLPFIGIVPLTPEDIIGSAVNVKYAVDIYTGSLLCSITVTKSDGAKQTMYTYSGDSAVKYPLTSGNLTGVVNGLTRMVAGGLVGGVAGAVVGGVSGALSGGASVSRSGGFSGNSGAMGYKKPYIIISRKIPDDAYAYSTYYGFPANKTVTLSVCRGFTRVKEVHVDNIINASQEEKTAIEQMLKEGVIIQ